MCPSLVAQRLKRLPAMRETWVRSLGWEDPLEKEMATASSIFAWRIPWTEEPVGLQSIGPHRVGYDWTTSLSLCMKCSLGISNFLEEISSIFHSIVFLYFCTAHLRFSYLLAIFWNSAFSCVYLSLSPLPLASLLFSPNYKASSDNHFAFFFFGMVLITPSSTLLLTSIHSSSDTLSIRYNSLNLFFTSIV